MVGGQESRIKRDVKLMLGKEILKEALQSLGLGVKAKKAGNLRGKDTQPLL